MNSSDNKNLIVALVLMLAVWLGFSILFPPEPRVQAPVQDAKTAEVSKPQVETMQPAPVSTAPEFVGMESAVVDLPQREITVDTGLYEAIFSTSGARLISFRLKEYRETAKEDSPAVQMFKSGPLQYASLRTTGSEGFPLAEDTLFESESSDRLVLDSGDQRQLSFQRTLANGVKVVKTYTLNGDSYAIETELRLVNGSPTPLQGTIGFALVQRWDESLQPDAYTFAGPASLVAGEIEEIDVDDLKEASVSYSKDVSWTTFQTKYFLSAAVPGEGAAERVQIQRRDDAIINLIESPRLSLQGGESRVLNYFLFIGPKEFDLLKAEGHRLDEVVHFGFFDVLAKPLFFFLNFIYGYLKNYGLAIILLTVVIKLFFWPLTHKSYASMKSMQKLQPEMQKLREKFKGDKERLNKELMELYKTHKVNPLGGCLPMLVQIPVFFALYKVLLDSIALRHAPFALWLTDLSAKDPYYITPILMGASMFVQQKMTPMASADPMQARIFMMMPIIFTFLFLNFPSGLVIYWLVNNLLTILQQFLIHRKKD